jgi:hypothetical protein
MPAPVHFLITVGIHLARTVQKQADATKGGASLTGVNPAQGIYEEGTLVKVPYSLAVPLTSPDGINKPATDGRGTAHRELTIALPI